MHRPFIAIVVLLTVAGVRSAIADPPEARKRSDPPVITSSWDDLLTGIDSPEKWQAHRKVLRQRYLDLLRDEYKPEKPPLDIQEHESVVIDGAYTRRLISYNVESDERAHAYLGVPLNLSGKAPAIVALHGTFPKGKERAAGLVDNPDKAYLDHLCRRGYVVIAPDHFVAGHRIPPEGSYETGRLPREASRVDIRGQVHL